MLCGPSRCSRLTVLSMTLSLLRSVSLSGPLSVTNCWLLRMTCLVSVFSVWLAVCGVVLCLVTCIGGTSRCLFVVI